MGTNRLLPYVYIGLSYSVGLLNVYMTLTEFGGQSVAVEDMALAVIGRILVVAKYPEFSIHTFHRPGNRGGGGQRGRLPLQILDRRGTAPPTLDCRCRSFFFCM